MLLYRSSVRYRRGVVAYARRIIEHGAPRATERLFLKEYTVFAFVKPYIRGARDWHARARAQRFTRATRAYRHFQNITFPPPGLCCVDHHRAAHRTGHHHHRCYIYTHCFMNENLQLVTYIIYHRHVWRSSRGICLRAARLRHARVAARSIS